MCSVGRSYTHTMKSLLKNHPTPVYDSLLGNALTNKNLVVLENHCIIMRRDHQTMKGKVKIIGGGGAGTEPADAYYVGKGMLTAAVLGEVFAAPSAHEILVAIRELAEENCDGILLLVKNYVGDKINFSLALEKALREEITVKMLVLGEDISHSDSRKGGLAGCVLVYKILGEMAEQGKTLEDIIEEYNEYVLPELATVNVTSAPCTSTICDPLMKYIAPNEVILGIGIYGKGGAKKVKITNLKNAIEQIIEENFFYLKPDTDPSQNDVVILVNNLGGTSKLEEAIIAKEVTNQITDLGMNIIKLYVGTFMSTLDTQGFSISVLKINFPDLLKYLIAPTEAPAWPQCEVDNTTVISLPSIVPPKWQHDELNKAMFEKMTFGETILTEKATAALKQITIFASEALISCEKQLNIIDAEAGDGDTGSVLKKGAEALRKAVLNEVIDLKNPCRFLFELSEICCKYMGGLSGALYSVFFSSAAKVFQNCTDITPELCCTAFRSGVRAIKFYGERELGDRTILDALCPAVDSFETVIMNERSLSEAVYSAATTCEFKAEETKSMRPLFMQDMNINQPLLYADAGAHAATIWLRAITFEAEIPTQRPGIFLWKFLTQEESNYVLEKGSTIQDLMSFIEKKLGSSEVLLAILLLETLKYCRKKFPKKPKPTSCLTGTVYYTHQYFMASRQRTPPEVYFYFRESILCQSVESPPTSMEVFQPEEARDVLLFFFETYIRNLPLVSIMHKPHYKLRLKIPEGNSEIKDRNSLSKGEKK